MKSILLIGLGRFGRHVAEKLYELDHKVLAVDKQEDRVEAVMSYVTNAQIGDSTNMEFLETLGVSNFDVCIVAIASDFQSSLETTALLKEQGARFVLSRAARDVHRQHLVVQLLKLGGHVPPEAAQSDQQYRFHPHTSFLKRTAQPTVTRSWGSCAGAAPLSGRTA